MVFAMKVKGSENEKALDPNVLEFRSQLFQLPPGIYEILDKNDTLPQILKVTLGYSGVRTVLAIDSSAPLTKH